MGSDTAQGAARGGGVSLKEAADIAHRFWRTATYDGGLSQFESMWRAALIANAPADDAPDSDSDASDEVWIPGHLAVLN